MVKSAGAIKQTDGSRQLTCPHMQDETRASLITATCASSLISCFIMGAFANMPVALAPGIAELAHTVLLIQTTRCSCQILCMAVMTPSRSLEQLSRSGAAAWTAAKSSSRVWLSLAAMGLWTAVSDRYSSVF